MATKTAPASRQERPLPDDRLRDLLHMLKLCRYFDERMEALYRQGRLPGAIYSGRGQEGTHVGVVSALRPEDSLFATHRDLSAQFAKGLELERVMAQFWGRIDGYLRGRDGNSHIGDWQGHRTFAAISHLPIAYPVAVGAALAYQRAGDDRVALAICGDGSTSNGRWHEAINTSAIHRLPVVWVVNNNQFAYSTPNAARVPHADDRRAGGRVRDPRCPRRRRRGPRGLRGRRRRPSSGHAAAADPTLIESVSLRWRGHAGHDPAKYVPREMLEDYMANHDPVKNFEEYLLARGRREQGGHRGRPAARRDRVRRGVRVRAATRRSPNPAT